MLIKNLITGITTEINNADVIKIAQSEPERYSIVTGKKETEKVVKKAVSKRTAVTKK